MLEADYSLTQQAMDAGRGMQTSDDDVLFVRFFIKPRKNDARSAQEGRPIFEDCEYVEIRQPGNSGQVVCKVVNNKIIERFPRHYAAYKQRSEVLHEGTPLSEWPLLTRSQVEELKALSVHTVEQLANMSDGNALQHMGVMTLKQKAAEWLATVTDNVDRSELQAALKEKDDQIAALLERIEALEAKPKRGRPKKQPEDTTTEE